MQPSPAQHAANAEIDDEKSRAPRDPERTKVFLAAYSEICKSYHAIDDFRTKLLGFLPLTSLAGMLLLDTNKLFSSPTPMSHDIWGFAGLFAALLTLALFGYEVRGMQRTHHLVREGIHLEKELGIGHGQFHLCAEEHTDQSAVSRMLNAKVLACIIYSVVFAAWLFITLRLGFGIGTLTCAICGLITGCILAGCVSLFLRKLIPA